MEAISPDISPADEVLDFLLSAPTPEPQERLRYLLDGNRNEPLTDGERADLDAYLQVEQFVRQLKIHAREKFR